MGVDHGGLDILVPEQFLDGADVVAILEKMGGEGMAEGVRGDVFSMLAALAAARTAF